MNKNQILIICFLISFNQVIFAQQKNESNKLDLKKESYFELAALEGTPTLINLSGAYWFKPVGLRLSGGYFDYNVNGMQFNLNYKLTDNLKTRHTIGMAIGKSQDQGCEYFYFGPVYDYTYKHLFVEVGVSKVFNVIRGDFSDLPYWVIIQVGYVHRFLPNTKNNK